MRRIGGSEVIKHVLVDGGNLIHRSYFAFVDSPLSKGIKLEHDPYIITIYGMLKMLANWLKDFEYVTKVSIFFDGKPSRRVAIDPEYKANRQSRDIFSNLNLNFDTNIIKIFNMLGCDSYYDENEEADDLIASFCAQNPETVRFIISDDKDFFQLLTDQRIVIYRPGSKEGRFFDAEASEACWAKLNQGSHPPVKPAFVRMFKTLCGDSSDNITGIPNFKKKVAVTISHFNNVEDMCSSGLNGLTPLEKSKVFENRDKLIRNFKLTGMIQDIDLNPCKYVANYNLVSVKDIFDNFGIHDIDYSSYRVFAPKMNRSDIPDFLSDI